MDDFRGPTAGRLLEGIGCVMFSRSNVSAAAAAAARRDSDIDTAIEFALLGILDEDADDEPGFVTTASPPMELRARFLSGEDAIVEEALLVRPDPWLIPDGMVLVGWSCCSPSPPSALHTRLATRSGWSEARGTVETETRHVMRWRLRGYPSDLEVESSYRRGRCGERISQIAIKIPIRYHSHQYIRAGWQPQPYKALRRARSTTPWYSSPQAMSGAQRQTPRVSPPSTLPRSPNTSSSSMTRHITCAVSRPKEISSMPA